ncbi:MAG: FecR domain-containing protein [Erythrobacter sp.]|nr:FecR domain-containing protein [Erythrobacter sp.]
MDWDAFTAWLEADPAHARAYDEVSLADAALGEIEPPAPLHLAANDDPAQPVARGGWYRWAGTAIAACLLVVLSFAVLRPDAASVYHTEGQSMTVTLDDGSQVVLAPASELTVDGDQLALSGGAWFDVRHDPDRQLVIAAGLVQITDIGTRFDVQAAGQDVRVAVSEGRVSVRSEHLQAPVQLTAGRQLHFDGASGRSLAAPVEAASVGGWRSGQLTYADVPLRLVSADLSRYAGVEIEVPQAMAGRMFSGTLTIDDGNAAARDLSQLMGLGLERAGACYRLVDPAD